MRASIMARRLQALREMFPGCLFAELYACSSGGFERFGMRLRFLEAQKVKDCTFGDGGKTILLGGETTIRGTLATAERNARILRDAMLADRKCESCGQAVPA